MTDAKFCCQTRRICKKKMHAMPINADFPNIRRHCRSTLRRMLEDAQNALELLTAIDFERDVDLGDGVSMRLSANGHILGSAFARMQYLNRTILLQHYIKRHRAWL